MNILEFPDRPGIITIEQVFDQIVIMQTLAQIYARQHGIDYDAAIFQARRRVMDDIDDYIEDMTVE